MKGYYGLAAGLVLAACENMPPPGADCGASAMQPMVGRDSLDVVRFIDTQPAYVRNNAYYFGQSEEVGEEIPSNALIVEISADEIHKPEDLLGTTITRVYCNET